MVRSQMDFPLLQYYSISQKQHGFIVNITLKSSPLYMWTRRTEAEHHQPRFGGVTPKQKNRPKDLLFSIVLL